jgi:hypothetical protein
MMTTPLNDSLLHPNQFERVMKGNCPGGSRNYKTCADLAYATPGTDACDPVTQQRCQDPVYFLGVRTGPNKR